MKDGFLVALRNIVESELACGSAEMPQRGPPYRCIVDGSSQLF